MSFELRLGEIVVHAKVRGRKVTIGRGPMPGGASLAIDAGPGIRKLMAQEITPAEALADGTARISGDPKLFARFAEMFRI